MKDSDAKHKGEGDAHYGRTRRSPDALQFALTTLGTKLVDLSNVGCGEDVTLAVPSELLQGGNATLQRVDEFSKPFEHCKGRGREGGGGGRRRRRRGKKALGGKVAQ